MSLLRGEEGDGGDDVRRLQESLNAKGATLVVDGDFGPATEAAVKLAQKKAGQTASGVADGALWAWLEARGGPPLFEPTEGHADDPNLPVGGVEDVELYDGADCGGADGVEQLVGQADVATID